MEKRIKWLGNGFAVRGFNTIPNAFPSQNAQPQNPAAHDGSAQPRKENGSAEIIIRLSPCVEIPCLRPVRC